MKARREPGNILNELTELKRVIIHNSYGENLMGILHETRSEELVIICHGFRSSKDRIPMANLAFAFEREGISAFRFDFTGNGESEGSFQYGNYNREAEDLRDVVKHFRAAKRFVTAVVGHSKGGNAVLLYASRYNYVETVVNIAGRFNLRRGIEGRLGKDFQEKIKLHGFIDVVNRKGEIVYRVSEGSLMDRLKTDILAACRTIPLSCRVLTVHGTEDEIVPIEDAVELSTKIKNHTLHIVEGADHEYSKHQTELASIVVGFVKKKSMPKPNPTSSCRGSSKASGSCL
ncbi:putative uncharacterized protein YDL057W isoform X1 [Primulina eburnea]|uniref:putative uncharacterized protein YDL057W isoform X1 n=2 Tax=Primulina eburnea TaxID=1245227 RepID=UPI003C6C804F